MKYERIKEPVWIVSIEHKNSRHHKYDCFDLQMQTIQSQTKCNTWIDSTMANYHQWEPIISAVVRGKGVIISNLKWKDPAKGLVNADSVPDFNYCVERHELTQILEDYWESQKPYGKLFK